MDQDDEEQVQRLKAWWRENGPAIVTGIALAAVAAVGWWGYKTWQERSAQQAAAAYAELLRVEQEGRPEDVAAAGERIIEEHSDSGYAAMAALRAARAQVEAGAFQEAAETLGGLVERADRPAMAELARLRKARALSQVDAEQALEVLKAQAVPGFGAARAELRGDLLASLGRSEEASAAYREALDAEGMPARSREAVRLKLQATEPEA